MAAKKTVARPEPEDETTAAAAEPTAEVASEPAAEPVSAGSKTEVTIKFRDHNGEPTERTFSKDVHGANFAKLAAEFKATNASRILG